MRSCHVALLDLQALQKVQQVLGEYKAQGKKSAVFIVGRGLHSADGQAKLKPAVTSLINKHNLRCTVGFWLCGFVGAGRGHVGTCRAERADALLGTASLRIAGQCSILVRLPPFKGTCPAWAPQPTLATSTPPSHPAPLRASLLAGGQAQ